MGARRAPLLSAEEIRCSFGDQFADDLRPHLSDKRIAVGTRHFLGWIERSNSLAIVKKLVVGQHDDFEEPWVVQTLHEALTRFYEETFQAGFAHRTTRERCRHVCLALEYLGELADRKYPPVEADFFRPPWHNDEPAVSLGELEWHEYRGLEEAARDRKGLSLLTEQALADFNRYHAIFQFGQTLLRSGTETGSSRSEIQRLVFAEKASWEDFTKSAFERKWDLDFRRIVKPLGDRAVWQLAGFPDADELPAVLSSHDLRQIAMNMLGAPVVMTDCVVAIFCCETGWNKQTTQDLKSSPHIFRTDRGLSICDDQFFAQFKGRAGLNVLKRLGRSEPLSAIAADEFEAAWRATANLPTFATRDGFSSIRGVAVSSLLNILDRYKAATSFAHSLCKKLKSPMEHRFFVSLGRRGLTVPAREIGVSFKTGPLSRKGVTFTAARKSRLNLTARSSRSTVEARAAGDHRNSRTTYKYYYTRETLTHKLVPVRAFQNILQGVLTFRNGVLAAVIDPTYAEFYRLLAHSSGVASACGLSDADEGFQLPTISFEPTHARLIELYLAYRAIKERRHHISEVRWWSQGRPLLVIAGGVIRGLHEVGLFPLYRKAAREAVLGLRDGTLALPPVLEV